MFERYQHSLWDWNGTLFDDAWLCIASMNHILERHGLPLLTHERYRDVFRFPVREYYRDLGLDFSRESFEHLSVEFMAYYEARKTECNLFDGVHATLAHVRQFGIGQSILSAYPLDSLLHIVRHFQLDGYFDYIFGLSDIYAHSKVELGQKWMRERGYAQGDVLMIGDTEHDFEVAQAIGADCLLIADGHNAKARLTTLGAPVMDTLGDLLAL